MESKIDCLDLFSARGIFIWQKILQLELHNKLQSVLYWACSLTTT